MTHEECKNNEIIGNKKPIQHPTIAMTVCKKVDCTEKKCEEPCESDAKPKAIGHATHSDKYPGVPLSNTDFKKEPKAQYGRFYKERCDVSQPKETLDVEATKVLNENKEMNDTVRLMEKFYQKND